MLRIAAFAAVAGVSSHVLRDYDHLGLFRPAWVDPETGYRMYSPAQLPLLRRIVALRDIGASLDEIRALVVDGSDLREVLVRRRRALKEAHLELDRRLASVGISLAAVDAGEAGPDVVVREVAAELVATRGVATTGGDVGAAFYELERSIRDAGVRAPRPPGFLIADDEVFVPVRRRASDLDVRRLPAIRAATILHHGPYRTIRATIVALEAWLAAAGLEGGRDARILYLQFGAEADLRLPPGYVVDRDADLVTEIQVPLETPTTSA